MSAGVLVNSRSVYIWQAIWEGIKVSFLELQGDNITA
jgi:hypothetical protein